MTWHTQSSISNIGKQYSLSYLGLPVSSSFRVTGLKKRERELVKPTANKFYAAIDACQKNISGVMAL